MYSDVFCKVYNEFGWNYYPEAFGGQLLEWIRASGAKIRTSLDLACGTGVLCEILHKSGINAAGMDLSPGMIEIARKSNPHIRYDVADMVSYRPEGKYDLVTCTGDAINHILDIADVDRIFSNVYGCLNDGGWFIFDVLNEHEISTSDPFEMDYSDTTRVWFQMTRPAETQVALTIRVYENGQPQFEQVIRETVHDPVLICRMLADKGFREVRRGDRLLEHGENHGSTWFVTARK